MYNYSINDELKNGVELISEFLDIDENIEIRAECGEKNILHKEGNVCSITYSEKVWFFRALSILKENINKKEFAVEENKRIRNTGIHIDFSRNGALTVDSLKRFMSYMAMMGMNKLYLYIEDMFEIPGRKYFGYLRGRYSKKELMIIDDMGFDLGIEVIPSIQVLGHHWQYLQWDESADIRDTAAELLVDDENTYKFIENMLSLLLDTFRTRTIFLGMDETHTLGLGQYLKRNGYEKPSELFLRHMNKVYEIAAKLGIRGISSGDMFFDHASPRHYYYDKDAVITEETRKLMPENLTLCYWHYGEEYGCDGYMMERHKQLGKEFIFFGGCWTWSGHLPETEYALDCTEKALKECLNYGVDEAIITIWGDDGNECSQYYGLLTAQYAAEYAFGNEENFKERFESVTGASAEAFIRMSAYQNINDAGIEYEGFMPRFRGKAFFWHDILLGQLDYNLSVEPMSGHYKKSADYFEKIKDCGGIWQKDYEFIYNIFRCLEVKCYVAENLTKAYKAGNKELLSQLSSVLKEKLLPFACECHRLHKEIWFANLRPFGWEVEEMRYGALEARIKTASERIDSYLAGDISAIEELEEERLPYSYTPFTRFRKIYTTTFEC